MRIENGKRLSVHLASTDVEKLRDFCTEMGADGNISEGVRQLARHAHIISAIAKMAAK